MLHCTVYSFIILRPWKSYLSDMPLSSTLAPHHPSLALPSFFQHSSHALICTRVDIENSIIPGLSSLNISKLQSIHTVAACLISGLLQFAHISAFIWDTPHQLPLPQLIQFKILLTFMHNSLVKSAPSYLQTLYTSVSSIYALVTSL